MTDRNNRLDWTLLLPSSLELRVEDVLVLGGTAAMAEDLVARGVAKRWRRPEGADRAELVVSWADSGVDVGSVARHTAARVCCTSRSIAAGEGAGASAFGRSTANWREASTSSTQRTWSLRTCSLPGATSR